MSKIIDYIESLAKTNKEGGICHGQKHAEKLQEKIQFAKQIIKEIQSDDILWLNQTEERLLGISLSAKKSDVCNLSEVSHKCKDFFSAPSNKKMIFGVDILEVRESITFGGQNAGEKRCDLTVCDDSAKLKVKVWSDTYQNCASVCVEKNAVILYGEKGFGRYSDFFIAKRIEQAR